MTGYHVTERRHLPAILEQGLRACNTQREGNYQHDYLPDNDLRAVFFHRDLDEARYWARGCAPYVPVKDKAIIEVDLRRLRLENDPAWSGAVRVRRSVHRNRIRRIHLEV